MSGLPASPARFAWYYARRYPVRLGCVAFFAGLIAFTGVAAPYFLKPLIEIFMRAENPGDVSWTDVVPICLGFFLVGFVLRDTIASHAAHIAEFTFSTQVACDIRDDLFRRVLAHSPSFLQDEMAGRVAGKIADAETQTNKLLMLVFSRITGLLVFAGLALTASFWMYTLFGWFLLGWTVLYMTTTIFLARKAPSYAHDMSAARSALAGRLVDVLSCFALVRQFARDRDEADAYKSESDNVRRRELKLWWYIELVVFFQGFIKLTLFAPLIPLLFHGWQTGAISAGTVAFLIPLTIQFEGNIYGIRTHTLEGLAAYGILRQALQVIRKEPDLTDCPDCSALLVRQGGLNVRALEFRYPGQDTDVFRDLNLSVEPGQRVGLIGPSGAGKSTLVSLLLRFYDPTSGRIEIDGQDIKYTTQDSLRRAVAVIPQDTSLFHRSLRDNIAYGRPEASFDEIVEAARKAHAHDFIGSLPQGYDTMVGERGVKLSGGQRQRIAIARAILKNAPILLLDEATSALDSESEKLIQASLEDLMDGKTVIAIAHRLSTITHLDRLLVMDRGRIVEDGAHQDLIAAGGLYARLWSMQSGGFIGDM